MQPLQSIQTLLADSRCDVIRLRITLLLVLFCAGSAGCGDGLNPLQNESSAEPVAAAVLSVNVIRPEVSSDVPETVVCFGKFKPTREALLPFARSGVVADVRKRAGDRVVEGELLANLDQQVIVEQQRNAEAALQRAKADAQRVSQSQAAQMVPQIRTLEAQLNALNAEFAKAELKAPFTGIVAECNVESGAVVSAQMTAFVIIEDKSPLVEVNLDKESAARLTDGQQLWVGHNDAALLTEIQQRSPIRGPAGGEQLLLEFEQPLAADQWLSGKVVEIRFRVSTDQSGYWLPISALQQSADGPWSVLLTEKSAGGDADQLTVVRRECLVGRHEDERVLVSGIDLDNALVIADGSHRVVPGQTVTAVEALRPDDALPPKGEQ